MQNTPVFVIFKKLPRDTVFKNSQTYKFSDGSSLRCPKIFTDQLNVFLQSLNCCLKEEHLLGHAKKWPAIFYDFLEHLKIWDYGHSWNLLGWVCAHSLCGELCWSAESFDFDNSSGFRFGISFLLKVKSLCFWWKLFFS